MLRFRPISDAKKALAYYSKSDGGYTTDVDSLRQEWGGKAAEKLGISGDPQLEHFARLLNGLDPHTGAQLTAKLVDNRLAGWDVTASIPKGVTTLIERGDRRVHQALWETNREAMADLQEYATTRVRKGGEHDDRVTGNLVWFSTEHAETRPDQKSNLPDWDRHIHNVVFNLTHDGVEAEWKAVKFRPIMDLRKFFDRRFDMRLASKLADLGYQIETRYKPDEIGGKRYFSWDVKGIPATVIAKHSHRSAAIEKLADDLGITSTFSKDRLGATSRAYKLKDMTLADYRKEWNSRITWLEGRAIADAISRAAHGKNGPKPELVGKAVEYAMSHLFERQAVVQWTDFAIAAMERAIGGGHPDEVLPEAKRQGVLLKDGEASTKDILVQESRVVAFASQGRGKYRGMGRQSSRTGTNESKTSDLVPNHPEREFSLSNEQQAAVRHIWESPDAVIMVRGGAGTGKTTLMQAAIAGIDKPVVVLAPSANASRGVLRKEGFAEADTLARFLQDEKFQQKAKDGVIWVDESGLVSMKQLDALFKAAETLNARVVISGDQRQHGSVELNGAIRLLEQFAGLPVAELNTVRRQQHKGYKAAVEAIAKGDVLKGFDILNEQGWVTQTPVFDHNKPLVDDYMAGVSAGKDMLVVAPTHKEGDEITAEIRKRLHSSGVLGEDRTIPTLKPTNWTEAERGDLERFNGDEIIQFHRNSGSFSASERVGPDALKTAPKPAKAGHFSVYTRADLQVAPGDKIRVTSNGWTKDRKHRLDNGWTGEVASISDKGDIKLANGWVIAADFGHLAHAYVSTSHASQGKTVDRVLIAMGSESLPAVTREQFYVSASRARESARIYTSISPIVLRDAIQKADPRKTATEVFAEPKPAPDRKPARRKSAREKTLAFLRGLRQKYEAARRRVAETVKERKDLHYAHER